MQWVESWKRFVKQYLYEGLTKKFHNPIPTKNIFTTHKSTVSMHKKYFSISNFDLTLHVCWKFK